MPLASGVMVTVLVVAVVALAYGAQPPVLGVAEFAPAAQQALTPPPTSQPQSDRGATGSARRARAAAASTTSTQPPPEASSQSAGPTTRVGRSRACIGDPPRQTEDPQSPPCINTIFDGDNGGATSAGVTGTDIRVAIPVAPSEAALSKQVFEALFAFFNGRFEFYGRRLQPVYVPGAGATPAELRAWAAETVTQQAFAVLPTQIEKSNPHPSFYQELARQGLVTVTRGAGQYFTDRTLYDPLHPYLWSVYPSAEQQWANLGDFACTALVGRPARHAASPTLRTATRKFGLISAGRSSTPWTQPLVDRLRDCDAPLETAQIDLASDTTGARGIVERMRGAGVTTIICACDNFFVNFWSLDIAADQEWLLPSLGGQGSSTITDERFIGQWIRAQPTLALPFGIASHPKILPTQASPWFQALVASDGALAANVASVKIAVAAYDQLLILASGIQGAGPKLTPDTLGQALMATRFPNPAAGQEPFWQQAVGFGPGDHSFYDDFAVVSWDRALTPLDPSNTNPGSWCYLDRGARFGVGRYPVDADSRLFTATGACR